MLRLDVQGQQVDVRSRARLQQVVTEGASHRILQEGTAGTHAPNQVIVQRVGRMGAQTALQVGTMLVSRVARHARAPLFQILLLVSIHHRRRC